MTDNEQQGQEKPKIIVDNDWKAQAEAEKDRLSKQEQAAPAGAEGTAVGGPAELPPVSFATLVGSLATQVFLALGGMEDPKTKKRYVDLDLAKYHIDTLTMLEEKTKGNLTEQERKLLDQAIYETRMQYVQIAQRVQ